MKTWRRVKFSLKLIVGVLVFIFLIQRSTYPTHLNWNAVAVLVAEHKFDYVTWTVSALFHKATHSFFGQQHYMTEADRSDFVREYMRDVARARAIEAEIDTMYRRDPLTDLTSLQAQRDALRGDLSRRQSTAEAIIESQVSAVLVDAGFGVLGQLLPPVSMRFTRMPNLLVVSPRDSIRRSVELALDPLSLPERVALEHRVESARDVSVMIVPLGGMAIFPAMIQESDNLAWIVETFAHEWVHHYFFFFPLGWNYFIDIGGSPEALIINETVADMVGREVAEMVLERYYPELVEDYRESLIPLSPPAEIGERTFDFGAAMGETRINVDHIMGRIARLHAMNDDLHRIDDAAIIAKNQTAIDRLVEKAERYMEHRRRFFLSNGLYIRRLNQAYFAFYGGYQGGIAGIGGADPIGPAVADIRAASDSLPQFMATMRTITSRAALLAERDGLLAAGG